MRMFWRLLGFLNAYRWQVALAVLLGVATIGSNMGLLTTAAYLISAAALHPLLGELMLALYLVRFFGVSRAVFRYTERLVSHDVTFRLLLSLRSWFYSRLEPLAPARLSAYRSGDLLSRLVKDIEELENVYLRVVSPVIVAVLISLLTFGLFYLFNPLLAWAALGFLAATGVGVPVLVKRLARGLGRRQLELRAELDSQIVDGFQGVQDILAFGRSGSQQARVDSLNRKLGRVQGWMALITGLQNSLSDLMMGLAMWTLLIFSIPLVVAGQINGVYLALLALAILSSFEAVQSLGQTFVTLDRSLSAAGRVFEVIEARPQVEDPPRSLPAPVSPSLEFKDVSFAYGPGEPPVLEHVSFTLSPGKRIAVVGPSGAGKSTLVNLILRFWDPVEGEILLGGHSLPEYAQEDLRRAIGVVAQSTYIFNETLRENLLLTRPDATDAELEKVLEQARLSEFVSRLPQGLDTWAGEQGVRLSGGERQRFAIARTLLKDASLLILDEATANLDPITERELLAEVRRLMQGRTTLMITHRLVEMELMDEVLVMDKGRIVERGTHEELIRVEGLYQRMLEVQNQMLVVP